MTATALVVDVVELQRRTGTRRPVVASVQLADAGVGERAVVDGRLDVDLVVEAVTEGIAVIGTASGQASGPCRRCLDEVRLPFTLTIREIYERRPTEGETWPIEDERIDLTEMLRELALLTLPLAPLCDEDCAGPDTERFPTGQGEDPDPDVPPARDERRAVLDQLRFAPDDDSDAGR